MRRGRLSGVAAVLFAGLALAPWAASETTHTYPVTLTISVDRAAHKLNGGVITEAPSEFCESSTIRIRKEVPGKDDIVARLKPYGGEWHMKSTAKLRGARVYAEALPYHLPERPVVCLGARSRTVTAP